MKKLFLIILSFLLTSSLFSQDYQFQAKVATIDANGFYKIDLKPEIVSKLNVNFSDIRIKDKAGKEVPYFIEKEPFSVTKRVFKEYQVIEKINWRNGATVLVVENKNKDTINNIQLQIKNFDVRKHIEVAASDDYINWYTIKENYTFYSADGQYTTSEVKSLNFPYTDYQFYRIIIYDWFSMPINVLKVGYYDTFQEQGKFKKLMSPKLYRCDSLETKQTYIKVNFKETPYLDQLIFKVDKPEYFNRSAKICLKKEDKKGRIYFETIDDITLNSNSDLTSYQYDFPYTAFYIIINNEDNPPLENIQIEAYQLNRYLMAYLESGNNYQLVFENDKIAGKPNYDINFFKDKIGKDIPILTTENIKSIPFQTKKVVTTSTIWIWIVICLVALLLGYFSYQMISEMEKK